jgi:hypothetical protein
VERSKGEVLIIKQTNVSLHLDNITCNHDRRNSRLIPYKYNADSNVFYAFICG